MVLASEIPLERFSEPTFVISGNAGLNHAHLEALLTAAGMRRVPLVRGAVVRFAWVELQETFQFDPVAYTVVTYVKNLFDDRRKRACVSDKGALHRMLQREYPAVAAAHLPATCALDALDADAVDWARHMYIVRPTGPFAWCGRGIERATSAAELRRIQRAKAGARDAPIASEYVAHPLLWHGRKMHLRTYFLVRGRTEHSPFHATLWSRAKILTAAKPYACAHFDDSAVHDSHVRSTPRGLFWPDDLRDALRPDQIAHIQQQMADVLACVARAFEPLAAPYPESRWGFEVFGCDFLVDAASLNVYLLECNERVGYHLPPGDDDSSGRYARFTVDYYNWVYDNALAPMLQLPPRSSFNLPSDLNPPPALESIKAAAERAAKGIGVEAPVGAAASSVEVAPSVEAAPSISDAPSSDVPPPPSSS